MARSIRRDRWSVVVPVVCAAGALGPQAAVAQEEAGGLAEVTVTGSRIVRDGISAPTPVTVVGAERLQNLGATNVGALLNTLPSFRASSNPQTANINPRAAGTSLADLRGLGPTRTLVLLNGRRFVPSTLEGAVDLNQIPTLLIERSEIVTGGASAQYGSDAVAGVVNLILSDKLEGIRTIRITQPSPAAPASAQLNSPAPSNTKRTRGPATATPATGARRSIKSSPTPGPRTSRSCRDILRTTYCRRPTRSPRCWAASSRTARCVERLSVQTARRISISTGRCSRTIPPSCTEATATTASSARR